MRAPFPYYGGKSTVAAAVWRAFGDVPNYIEPFFGSGAVLLARPHDYTQRLETVNDADALLANYWRATQAEPDAVAQWADWPINEADLHARHLWLTGQRVRITERLMADPDYYDTQVAGWWLWGICQWIGGHWCAGDGSWTAENGVLVKGENGVPRTRPHLSSNGMGIHRALSPGADLTGGQCAAWNRHVRGLMRELADRLRRVRVCCGDWSRICGPSVTSGQGLTGVFLDPPYSAEAGRDMNLYSVDSGTVAHAVREWAIENGADPRMRIALCGYDTEHAMPEDWQIFTWKTQGGYANQGDAAGRENAEREVIWFSPHCLGAKQPSFFDLPLEDEA